MDLDALRAALAVSPDNAPLLMLYAKACEDVFDLAAAKQAYEQVVALDSTNRHALLGICRVLEMAGETSQSIIRLELLCQAYPDYADAWLMLARLAMEEKDAALAGSCYARAIALDSTKEDPELMKSILSAGGQLQPKTTGKIRLSHHGMEIDEEEHEGGTVDDVMARELELEFRVKNTARFSEVGGMEQVKEQIRMKIIFPLENPQLFASYGKKAGGGVLLYGPPGCGKTLMARATAGEMGASFFSVGIHQVMGMYIGESENKLHQIFELARRNAPAVLFFDEMDALAADRRDMRQSAGRHLINQFLMELDGAVADNENVLVLGATNAPWHVDGAFLRPGRFDRVVFVPPPDLPAREQICKILAQGRPLTGFDEKDLGKRTDGLSGADIKAVFDEATEVALTEAMRKGSIVPITQKMLAQSAKSAKPSTRKWFESAKNYALYANQGGLYDEVLTYMGLKK